MIICQLFFLYLSGRCLNSRNTISITKTPASTEIKKSVLTNSRFSSHSANRFNSTMPAPAIKAISNLALMGIVFYAFPTLKLTCLILKLSHHFRQMNRTIGTEKAASPLCINHRRTGCGYAVPALWFPPHHAGADAG